MREERKKKEKEPRAYQLIFYIIDSSRKITEDARMTIAIMSPGDTGIYQDGEFVR
jgi:hypothetical protein